MGETGAGRPGVAGARAAGAASRRGTGTLELGAAMTDRAQDGDRAILHRISAMIADERDLREQLAARRIEGPAEREQLAALERELDQCWDLLRQRQAKESVGENPDTAHVRPSGQVEGYLG